MRMTVIVMLLVSATTTNCCDADLVGVSWPGGVYRVKEGSGTAVVINDFAMLGMNSLAGGRQLYTIGGSSDNILATIDPVSGELLSSKTLPVSDFRAMAYSSTNQLYATHTISFSSRGGMRSELMVIDAETATVSSLGTLDLGIVAMDFSPDGTLYAWDFGASGRGDGFGLITLATDGSSFTDVNPAIGTPRADIQSIAFGPDGTLYGIRDRLFTIDLATGAWTPVGTQVFGWDIRGIAFIVPEPSSLVLLAAFGITFVGFCRRNNEMRYLKR